MRAPAVIGWTLLFVPSAVFVVVTVLLFSWAFLDDLRNGDWGHAALSTLLVVMLVTLIVGFIRSMKRYLVEPVSAGNWPPLL
jgi:flagellar biosynthesis protein FliQ